MSTDHHSLHNLIVERHIQFNAKTFGNIFTVIGWHDSELPKYMDNAYLLNSIQEAQCHQSFVTLIDQMMYAIGILRLDRVEILDRRDKVTWDHLLRQLDAADRFHSVAFTCNERRIVSAEFIIIFNEDAARNMV